MGWMEPLQLAVSAIPGSMRMVEQVRVGEPLVATLLVATRRVAMAEMVVMAPADQAPANAPTGIRLEQRLLAEQERSVPVEANRSRTEATRPPRRSISETAAAMASVEPVKAETRVAATPQVARRAAVMPQVDRRLPEWSLAGRAAPAATASAVPAAAVAR